jgi:fatty-acyl-CoA synthase
MAGPIRLWVEVESRREVADLRQLGVVEIFLAIAGSPIYGRPGDVLAVRVPAEHLPARPRAFVASLPLRAGVVVPATADGLAILVEARTQHRSPRAALVGGPDEAVAAVGAGGTVLVSDAASVGPLVAGLPADAPPILAAVTSVPDAEVALRSGAVGLLVPSDLVPQLLDSPSIAVGVAPRPGPVRRVPPGRSAAAPSRPATIGATVDRAARLFGDSDAVVHVARGRRWTYADLRSDVQRAARAMLAVDIGPGDRVALWAQNVPEWPIVQLAASYIGAVLVTVNPSLSDEELEFILSNSGAGLLVAAPRNADQAEIVARTVRGGAAHEVRHVVTLPEAVSAPRAAGAAGRAIDWETFLADGDRIADSDLEARASRAHPDDVVNLLYTSGTTGFPKGAMLTHRGMLQNAAAVGGNLRLGTDDRICLAVPFHHCFGSVMGTLAALTFGAALIVPDDWFDAGAVLRAIAAERCTVLYGVPTMFLAELEHPERPSIDLTSLRTGIVAGAPVPFDLAERASRDLHLPELVVAYGLTEASPVVSQTAPSDPTDLRLGTVGRPIVGAEIRVVDPDTGVPVPDGATGELLTRGPMVMKGYFDQDEETASVIDRDGWLHSGDLATRDARGYLRIVGRLKDMIIRGGENVYPAEIESAGRRHPGVFDVQVVGVPSPAMGEEVAAFVRLDPDAVVGEEELRRHFLEHLAPFKVPRWIFFTEVFPTTGSGKVQKQRLREEAIERLAGAVRMPATETRRDRKGHAKDPAAGTTSGRPSLPLLPIKEVNQGASVTERDSPRPGWSRPAEPAWIRQATPATPEQETTMSPEDVRRRGQRIKTWGIGGDVRSQIEATGELPIMYRALGTPPQTRHPFNLYGDIKSQPDALRGTFETAEEIAQVARSIAAHDPIGAIGLGSGTSQFVAQVANAAYARFAGLPGWDYDSLHFLRYTPPVDFSRFVAMAYSGSGSTVDTVAATKQSRAAGAYTVAFTSIEGSPVVQASDARILTAGGFDTGGSDTFHYTTRIAAAIYLALQLGRTRRPDAHDYDRLTGELAATADRMAEIFDSVDARCQTIAERFRHVRSILVVGAGPNYGTAEEIALKFDEMAHLPTKPMNPGRHIHGALGLTEESILTILVAPPGPSYHDMVSLAKVTEILKTPSVAIVTEGDTEVADRCDYVIRLPVTDETIFAVLAVLPGQLLPYWCGVGLGLNPDTQRSNVPKHAKVWNMLFPPGTH